MSERASSVPNVLSIAGSDPSGGAGIQADLKTFAALGAHGMAVVTALTAQNTRAVTAIHVPPAHFVAEQVATLLEDVAVAAVKIGMLGSAAIAHAVADALDAYVGPLVLDPVLVATSGATLGDDDVVAAIRERLVPRATLVTPNLAEAARFAGDASIADDPDAIAAVAARLRGDGPAAWLVKGGHGGGPLAHDVLADGGGTALFEAPRLDTPDTHGTGCTLSSAVAVHLAHGASLRDAVAAAKSYVHAAIVGGGRLSVGRGAGPLDHFARWRDR